MISELPQSIADRGQFVLHASSVIRNSKVYAFCGLSGMGKSTLANTLIQDGYELFSDEVLTIDILNDTAQCYSFPQNLRLWKEAKKHIIATSKYHGPYELGALFILHKNQHESSMGLLLESTYKASKDNKALDQRLMEVAAHLSQNNLIHTVAYEQNQNSLASMQMILSSLI